MKIDGMGNRTEKVQMINRWFIQPRGQKHLVLDILVQNLNWYMSKNFTGKFNQSSYTVVTESHRAIEH